MMIIWLSYSLYILHIKLQFKKFHEARGGVYLKNPLG